MALSNAAVEKIIKSIPSRVLAVKSAVSRTVNSVYMDKVAVTRDYIVVICHGENPGCYPYLDFVSVYSLNRRRWELAFTQQVVTGNSSELYRTQQFTALKAMTDAVVKVTTFRNTYLYLDLDIYDKFVTGTTEREVTTPDDFSKLENLFNYKAVGQNGFVLATKTAVTVADFLNFPPFNKRFDYFAFEGVGDEQSSVSFESHRFNYGHSTTCCSDAVWKERDLLLECLHKVFPYNPVVNNLFPMPVYLSRAMTVMQHHATTPKNSAAASANTKDPFKKLYFDTKRTLISVVEELRANGLNDAQIFNFILTDLGDADCYKGRVRHK